MPAGAPTLCPPTLMRSRPSSAKDTSRVGMAWAASRVHETSAGVHELGEVCDRLNRADLGGHEGHGSEREATVPRGGRVVAGNTGQDGHAAHIHG